jgi:hypothetical protein
VVVVVVSGVAHYGLLVSFGNCACLHQTRSTNETYNNMQKKRV